MGNSTSKETKIQIFIWRGHRENIGHMSLYVPENFLYVSFWPADGIKSESTFVPATSHKYLEDIEEEGRNEDKVIERIPILNLSRMEERWNWIKANRKYSQVHYNCADALVEVLYAGNRNFIKDLCHCLENKQMENEIIFFEHAMERMEAFKKVGFFCLVWRYAREKKNIDKDDADKDDHDDIKEILNRIFNEYIRKNCNANSVEYDDVDDGENYADVFDRIFNENLQINDDPDDEDYELLCLS